MIEGIINSKYAEIAFGMHIQASFDEMQELMREFISFRDRTSVSTPSIDGLCRAERRVEER